MARPYRTAALFLAVVGVVSSSCNVAKPVAISISKKLDDPSSGTKDATPAQRPNLDNLLPSGQSLLKASYMTEAKSGRLRLCRGVIDLKVNAEIVKKNSTKIFEFPKAELDCGLLGRLDLTALLAGFSTSANPEMEVKGDVIHIKRLGYGWYDPSRPFLPSFLASSAKNLKRLNYTQDMVVNDTKANHSDRGTVTIRTLGYPTTYTPPGMRRTFKKVLDFEVTIAGFASNIDKPMNMLFDYLRFRVSLDPIAILSVDLTGKVKALADSAKNKPELQNTSIGTLMGILPDPNAATASAQDKLLGGFADLIMQVMPVTLSMTLESQEGLSDSNKDASDDVFSQDETD